MEYAEVDEYYYGEEVAGNATWETCEWQADWEASFSLLPLLYLLVFALGLSGNGLVLLTVWRGPRARRRSADAYIGNLALADLAFVATLPLWAAYTALRFHWPFGAALCKLSSFLVLLSICLNPLLYAFLDGRFRARCRLLLGPRRPPAAASTLSGPTQRSELGSAGTKL
ncbi:hypothetical protein AV530_000160 [Patagioenas fasciata monilis]|uniref:G-protein coupled receptors family 1 profile domain-containing protein n=1 Tax=Patagioenas fasciata monilis TaxID=372326 RepID=A0A1V4J1Z6_PATFA|nr:hypothetical protein AV530_000160 [Patagioenas fasciata monilis]